MGRRDVHGVDDSERGCTRIICMDDSDIQRICIVSNTGQVSGI